MRRNSTPLTRSIARDEAARIGEMQTSLTKALKSDLTELTSHRLAPIVMVAGFFGLVITTFEVIESIAL